MVQASYPVFSLMSTGHNEGRPLCNCRLTRPYRSSVQRELCCLCNLSQRPRGQFLLGARGPSLQCFCCRFSFEIIFTNFWLCHVACGISVPRPGTEFASPAWEGISVPRPGTEFTSPAWQVRSLSHWVTREARTDSPLEYTRSSLCWQPQYIHFLSSKTQKILLFVERPYIVGPEWHFHKVFVLFLKRKLNCSWKFGKFKGAYQVEGGTPSADLRHWLQLSDGLGLSRSALSCFGASLFPLILTYNNWELWATT